MHNRPSITPEADEIINKYHPVLDHGFVAVKDIMGSDEAIEEAARTSYQFGTRQKSATRGLLRYLVRHQHSSPLEMVEVKFHMAMPIFVARQIVRHRTASLNEVSGRYSLLPMQFYTPAREDFALQSKDNKQGRAGETSTALYDDAVHTWALGREDTQRTYEWLNAEGVARELARIDLPLSTYTNWYWKVDLRNLFHFLRLRLHQHAQKEVRAYAEVMAGMVKRIAPIAFEAWVDYELAAETFSYQEMDVLRSILAVKSTRLATEGVGSDLREDRLFTTLPNTVSASPKALEVNHGLTSREVAEFFSKLKRTTRPDFELDLSQMKDGSYFEEKMAAAVPGAK